MKKKMKATTAIAVLILIGGMTILRPEKVDVMSDMVIANIEALAYIPPTYTGLRYQEGELGTGGCINCPEPKDYSCTCR